MDPITLSAGEVKHMMAGEKIRVIKSVRERYNIGLYEAKIAVDDFEVSMGRCHWEYIPCGKTAGDYCNSSELQNIGLDFRAPLFYRVLRSGAAS